MLLKSISPQIFPSSEQNSQQIAYIAPFNLWGSFSKNEQKSLKMHQLSITLWSSPW